MQLQFQIEGQMQLSRAFLTASTTVKDWTPAFEQSSYDLIQIFSEDVFETEGEAIDEMWPELSTAYAIEKEKNYPGAGILVRTGLMRSSFLGHPSSMSLMIENTAPYFKYHQSTAPRTKLPRRAMMALTQNMRESVIKNFKTQWIEAMGG